MKKLIIIYIFVALFSLFNFLRNGIVSHSFFSLIALLITSIFLLIMALYVDKLLRFGMILHGGSYFLRFMESFTVFPGSISKILNVTLLCGAVVIYVYYLLSNKGEKKFLTQK